MASHQAVMRSELTYGTIVETWGVAEVKSIWPISTGPHTCHKGPRNGPLR